MELTAKNVEQIVENEELKDPDYYTDRLEILIECNPDA